MCEHKAPAELRVSLALGLYRGIHAFATLQGALTTARNGGSENVMRNHVLGDIEASTSCIAFTEGARARHDTDLHCCKCGEHAAHIEFKHNLLAQGSTELGHQRAAAIDQLAHAIDPAHPDVARYYVQFVFELRHDPASMIASRHNALLNNSLHPKRFMTPGDCAAHAQAAINLMGPVFSKALILPPGNDSARAVLHCWAFEYTGNGPENLAPLTQVAW